ncbi:33423_t:CDS:2, partial [Gigaspora margarita]
QPKLSISEIHKISVGIPIRPTEEEILMPVVVFFSPPTRQYLTRAGTVKELKLLKERIQSFENEAWHLSVKMALKYSVSQSQLQTTESNSNGDTEFQFRPIKRRKTLPFTRLLTNDESLQELEGMEELARKAATEKWAKCELESAQRKQVAAEKQAKHELESAQRKQRKVEAACKKK